MPPSAWRVWSRDFATPALWRGCSGNSARTTPSVRRGRKRAGRIVRGAVWTLLGLHLGLPVVLVGLPTLLMGMAFPLLQHAVQRDPARVGSRVGGMLAGNIAGSTIGSPATAW